MVSDETYLMYKQSTPKIGAGLEKKASLPMCRLCVCLWPRRHDKAATCFISGLFFQYSFLAAASSQRKRQKS